MRKSPASRIVYQQGILLISFNLSKCKIECIVECFIFGKKQRQEIIDTASRNSRENHEYHIEVDCIRVDLEKEFKR